MMRGSRGAIGPLWLTIGLAAELAAGQATFQGLGHLPGAPTPSSVASGISGDGLTVVGMSRSARGSRADGCCEGFRWTSAGGLIALGDLPGGPYESHARAVSADGMIAVGSGHTGVSLATSWHGASAAAPLPELPGGGVGGARAAGVSGDGAVIVGYDAAASGIEGFVYHPATGVIIGMGDLQGGAFRSQGEAVSADGAVAVGSSAGSQGVEAVRWTNAGGIEGLGDLEGGAFQSAATATSADGAVVVGFGHSGEGREAFRWTAAGGMQGLGDLSGGLFFSEALAASADGAVIVGYSKNEIDDTAFIWTAGAGMRSLAAELVKAGADVTGWRLRRATGVSADGQVIAGYGTNPLGVTEAWVATLPGCRADLTGDGALDFFDFLAFQDLFAAGDLLADFTGDGVLDFFDFLGFQDLFAAGCD